MDKELYIDFDGVILDSEKRFKKDMIGKTKLEDWIEYLSTIEWFNFLRECNQIDESLDTLKKLQKYKQLKGIITKIHVFEEGIQKAVFLRENGIIVPIHYVLPMQNKSTIVKPSKNKILVDDDIKNCIDWEKNGGTAILFDPYAKTEDKKAIKTLKKLL